MKKGRKIKRGKRKIKMKKENIRNELEEFRRIERVEKVKV